ncbi:MAG: hypothetical protein GWN79_23560 [Actinobacteria bacterium]|nr:hypothetical protein [Actinomycetota bacterium]
MAVTLYRDADCAGPSRRLTSNASFCGLTYDGGAIGVNDNVGSYVLEY